MLSRKKKIALFSAVFAIAATAGALSGGLQLTQAHHHWHPLDPGNYWSSTSISWADTAYPGHYFYHDLGRHGGSVHDLTREIKSKLFGKDFVNILVQIAQKLGIHETNRRPLDERETEDIKDIILKRRKDTGKTYDILADPRINGTPIFHQAHEAGAVFSTPRDKYKQHTAIANTAEIYASIAQETMARDGETANAILTLLDAVKNAKGKRELQEINEELQGIVATNKAQLSSLLAAKTQLEADKGRVDFDEHVEWVKEVTKHTMMIFDPYDPKRQRDYKASGKEKSAPRAFVSF